MYTFCHSSIRTNTQRNNANVTNKRRISLDILAETIKIFNGLTLQSPINDSTYYISDKDDREGDLKSDQLVATHTRDGKKRKVTDNGTTNRNSSHLLLINRIIPETIPVIIPSIDPSIEDGVTASRGSLHARHTITSKEIVTGVARSAVHVLRDLTVVNWKDMDGTIPWEFRMPP